MVTDKEFELERALVDVTTRLTKRFGERAERAVVEETVHRCAAEFADARIVTFIPILVERRSAECLVAMAKTPLPTVPAELVSTAPTDSFEPMAKAV